MSVRKKFRELLAAPGLTLMPGAYDALSARIIEAQGFEAMIAGSYAAIGSMLAQPDSGQCNMRDYADHYARICAAVDIPVYVDGDTGFGGVNNARQMVRAFEAAGVAGFFVSDQTFPNRCGYLPGKQVIPAAEMVQKLKAAVDARRDRDLLIIARTDAIAPEGFEPALARAAAYHEAGADVTFVEAPTSLEQMAEIPRRLPWPQILNIVMGGRTPELPNAKVKELGFAGVIYANVALQAAVLGMQAALGELKRQGHMGDAAKLVVDFSERQRLVMKHEYDALERKYADKS